MHAKGNDAPEIGTLMQWYDSKIRALLDAAEENYEDVSWYIFTDHGMHNVTKSYDLIADIESLGLEWNKDYVAFYDSTMTRIWILNEKARIPILNYLENHSHGQLLAEEELKKFGVWFKDGQYGDLVFLMNSGIQIVPSFMGTKSCKGMHGYHPSDADSFASISSNRPIPPDATKIQHIHQLMLSELELD
jgi:predicted AlkP superfamily pyrophosphatase or phosphodiesterase